MARDYIQVSVPVEVIPNMKKVSVQEGMEHSFAGFLGNIIRGMLVLRAENPQVYRHVVGRGNQHGWDGTNKLMEEGVNFEEVDIVPVSGIPTGLDIEFLDEAPATQE